MKINNRGQSDNYPEAITMNEPQEKQRAQTICKVGETKLTETSLMVKHHSYFSSAISLPKLVLSNERKDDKSPAADDHQMRYLMKSENTYKKNFS